MQYTSPGGETNKLLCPGFHTAAASVAPGDLIGASFWAKGSFNGASAVKIYLRSVNASAGWIGSAGAAVTVTSSAWRVRPWAGRCS